MSAPLPADAARFAESCRRQAMKMGEIVRSRAEQCVRAEAFGYTAAETKLARGFLVAAELEVAFWTSQALRYERMSRGED